MWFCALVNAPALWTIAQNQTLRYGQERRTKFCALIQSAENFADFCNWVFLYDSWCKIKSCAMAHSAESRAEHNFRCPLISPLSVDPLINGTSLIFHTENVNLTEERLFLSLFNATAFKIRFCRILYNLTLSTL
jgi:hypothetical protein